MLSIVLLVVFDCVWSTCALRFPPVRSASNQMRGTCRVLPIVLIPLPPRMDMPIQTCVRTTPWFRAYMDNVDPTDMDKTQSPLDRLRLLDGRHPHGRHGLREQDRRAVCRRRPLLVPGSARPNLLLPRSDPTRTRIPPLRTTSPASLGRSSIFGGSAGALSCSCHSTPRWRKPKLLIRGKVTRNPDADACSPVIPGRGGDFWPVDGRQASQIPRFRVFLRLCLHEDMHRNLEGCVERDLVSLKCMLPRRFGKFFLSRNSTERRRCLDPKRHVKQRLSYFFHQEKQVWHENPASGLVLIEGHSVHIFSGHSEKNLTVSVDGGDRQTMKNSQSTVFLLDSGVSVVGLVVAQEPASAGPDSLGPCEHQWDKG